MRHVLLLCFAGVVRSACLGGFLGTPCEMCQADRACSNSSVNETCPYGTHAMLGSTTCDITDRALVATSTKRYAPRRWSAESMPNPSNASCGCFIMGSDIFVTLDAGSEILVGGVAMQGRDQAWVSSFQVSRSPDNLTFSPVGGTYQANVEDKKIVNVLFPYVFRSRYMRIHIVEYFRWPSFRAAFLVALNTTCPKGEICQGGVILTTSQAPTTTAPTTTSEAPTTEAPTAPTTTAPPSCPLRVNMVITGYSPCAYACKPTAFGPLCLPRPRHSQRSAGAAYVAIQSTRPANIPCRLHSFGTQWALELPAWHGSDLSVQTDGGPWMAWNRKHWDPQHNASVFYPGAVWLLLPFEVRVRVQARVLWNNTAVVTLTASAATAHGNTVALYTPPDLRIHSTWGLGDSGHIGDSQALCSIRTSAPAARTSILTRAFNRYSEALAWATTSDLTGPQDAALFEASRACANVSHGLQWLHSNTELQGVQAHLSNFAPHRGSLQVSSRRPLRGGRPQGRGNHSQ